MISIFAVACSLLAGQTCRTVTLTYDAEAVSMYECFLYGQMELAKWAIDHPNWSISRWRCGLAGQEAAL